MKFYTADSDDSANVYNGDSGEVIFEIEDNATFDAFQVAELVALALNQVMEESDDARATE